MAAEFGDLDAATRMRGAIKRIVAREVAELRPDIRIGRVYSYDDTSQLAYILFPGEDVDSLAPVRYAVDKKPSQGMDENYEELGLNAPGNVVRVAGKPGSYFIIDFVSGIPRTDANPQAGIFEPEIDPGLTTEYWRGDKTWQLLNPTAVGAEPAITAGTTAQYFRGDKTWQTLNPVAVGAEPVITAGTTAQYWRGDKTWQVLNKAAVGLSDVDNTADSAKAFAGSQITSGIVAAARLGVNTPGATTYLRGDSAWIVLTPGEIGAAAAVHTHSASDTVNGTFAAARLGSGTPGAGNFLRGDSQWIALVKGDVGLGNVQNVDQTNASNITSGLVAPARLGGGTTDSTTYLRGDNTWQILNKAAVGLPNVDNTADSAKVFNASQITAGVFVEGRLGTGSGTSAKYLRGDSTWQALDIAAVTGLTGVLAGKADDTSVVHYAGAEDITGAKRFYNVQTMFQGVHAGWGPTLAEIYIKNLIGPAAIAFQSDYGTTDTDKGMLTYDGIFEFKHGGGFEAPVYAASFWAGNGAYQLFHAGNQPTVSQIAAGGIFPRSYLGTGTADSTNFLRGDGTWVTLTGGGAEPAIAAGTTSQYWRGDKTWQTLNFGAITGSLAEGQLPANFYSGIFVTDCNSATSMGLFYFGSGVLNAPTGCVYGVGWNLHRGGNSTQLVQYVSDVTTDRLWWRTRNTSWSAWVEAERVGHTHTGVYEPAFAAGTTAQYRRGDKTWQTLDKTAVGLPNVDNTSDVNKPVSTAQAIAIGLKQNTLDLGDLGSTVDWNTLVTQGHYRTTSFTGHTNHPSAAGQYGILRVTVRSTGVLQEYVSHSGGISTPYWRIKYNASDWTAWQTVSLSNHTHPTSDIITGVFNEARLGSGTGTSTKYLRGDSTWQTLDFPAIPGTLSVAKGGTGNAYGTLPVGGVITAASTSTFGVTAAGTSGQFLKSVGAGTPIWANLAAADVTSGVFAEARLGTGTGTSAKYLRGDSTWQTLDKAAVGLNLINNVAQVEIAGAQTITGPKTFSTLPINTISTAHNITDGSRTYTDQTRMWHDRLRFTTPTIEISTNGSAWSAAASTAKDVLDGKFTDGYQLPVTHDWLRFTWLDSGTAWATMLRLLLNFGYSWPCATAVSYTVESSIDGAVWTSRASGSLDTVNLASWIIPVGNHNDHDCHRITFQVTAKDGAATNNFTLLNLEYQTNRPDSGGGPQAELPYSWYHSKEMLALNHWWPFTNNVYDLGVGTNRWRTLYAVGGNFSGQVSGYAIDVNRSDGNKDYPDIYDGNGAGVVISDKGSPATQTASLKLASGTATLLVSGNVSITDMAGTSYKPFYAGATYDYNNRVYSASNLVPAATGLTGVIADGNMSGRLRTSQAGTTAQINDANLAVESGLWYWSGSTNGPSGVSAGEIYVAAYDATYLSQILVVEGSDQMWMRRRNASTWTGWVRIIDKTYADTLYNPLIAAGITAQYYRGDKTWQTLNAAAAGLGNVTNDAQVKLAGAQTIADVKTFSSSPIVPTATTSSQATNKGQMDTAIAAMPPMGQELGYAEITSNVSKTGTTAWVNTTVGLVAGLSVTVTGTGRPVDIEYYCNNVSNSAAGNYSVGWILEGTSTHIVYGYAAATYGAGSGSPMLLKRRMVLTNAVSYTFKAGLSNFNAGTATLNCDADAPAYLSVVQR